MFRHDLAFEGAEKICATFSWECKYSYTSGLERLGRGVEKTWVGDKDMIGINIK